MKKGQDVWRGPTPTPRSLIRTSRLGAACYVFTAFFMGLWAATQFVAWRVAYHPSLGPNLHGVYPPWDILVWWRQGGDDAFPDLFLAGGPAGTGITAVMLIFFIITGSCYKHKSSCGNDTRFSTLGGQKRH